MEFDFNICGCCVSREAFNIPLGNKYVIGDYTQCLAFSIFSDPINEKYTVADDEVKVIFEHDFTRRVLKNIINNTIGDLLLHRKGEWLILDTHYISSAPTVIEYPDGSKRLLSISAHYRNGIKTTFEKYEKFKGCKVYQVDASNNIDYYAEKTIKFIKENWGQKVIVINCPRAYLHIDDNMNVVGKSVSVHPHYLGEYHMCELFLKSVTPFIIDIPKPLIGDDYFDYKGSAVHYISETFVFLKKMIDCIHDNYREVNLISLLNQIIVEYEIKIGKIVKGITLSERNATEYLKNRIKKNDYSTESIGNVVDYLVGLESPWGYYVKGRIIYTSRKTNQDLCLAEKYIKKAVENNIPKAKGLLCHILWDINTPESLSELEQLINSDYLKGGVAASGWLGRINLNPVVINRDEDLGRTLLSYAARNGVPWAVKDYTRRFGKLEGPD